MLIRIKDDRLHLDYKFCGDFILNNAAYKVYNLMQGSIHPYLDERYLDIFDLFIDEHPKISHYTRVIFNKNSVVEDVYHSTIDTKHMFENPGCYEAVELEASIYYCILKRRPSYKFQYIHVDRLIVNRTSYKKLNWYFGKYRLWLIYN